MNQQNISFPSEPQSRTKGIFFIQKRVWKDGKVFEAYKVQTMVEGADTFISDEALTTWNKVQSDKVIPSRAWLRTYCIDETPQIVNIILWDMCFFGHRPMTVAEFSKLTPLKQQMYTRTKPWVFGSYAFWKDSQMTNHQRKEVYQRMRYKKEKEWKTPLILFHLYIFKEEVKMVLAWINK